LPVGRASGRGMRGPCGTTWGAPRSVMVARWRSTVGYTRNGRRECLPAGC